MKQEIVRLDLDGVNCYLGIEDNNFILFDTGGHLFLDKKFDNRRDKIEMELEKELKKQGCNVAKLRLIVLTHGDNDHVANAAYLRKKHNVKIAMHSEDADLVNNPTLNKLMENCHYHSIIFKLVYFIMKGAIKKIMLKTIDDYESFIPDILLNEGFNLSEYGFEAKIIHIPGHTKGSIGIITAQSDLISGDTFANTRDIEIAPNAYNFKVLSQSIERLKSLNIKTIYPGHGKPFDANLLKE